MQGGIKKVLKKAETITSINRDAKDNALKAEAMLVTACTSHNIPETFYDCLVPLLKEAIPDSKIVRNMEMGRTKGGYLLTHGIADYYRAKIVEYMKKYPFSLNYDGSVVGRAEQLDINVSFRGDEDLIWKANYTTVVCKEGSTGEAIGNYIIKALNEDEIPLSNWVSDMSDGCATMLGKEKGCHTILKVHVPTLPDTGGCFAHIGCNIIKQGVKTLNPNLTTIFKCIHSNLEKHSQKKNRRFRDINEYLGQEYRHVPRFVDVRFRVVMTLVDYLEDNDTSLHAYYTEVADEYKKGDRELSESETLILEHYLGNYILVRLQNKFLKASCKEIINFIDFFESRSIRVHQRYTKAAELLTKHMSYWLKNGGSSDGKPLTVEEMSKFKPRNGEKLSRRNVFIGTDTRSFIETIGLDYNSPELDEFFDSVFRFYEETTEQMIKFFKPTFDSRTVRYLEVIAPEFQRESLDRNKERWNYLLTKFPNIIPPDQRDAFLAEIAVYVRLDHPDPGEPVDEWWARVADVVIDGQKAFPLMSKFALALATMYNSSSEAERDFSKQTNIYQNTHVTNLSQKKLQCKLTLQSTIAMQATFCSRCENALEERADRKKKGEAVKPYKCKHCHCNLLKPDEGLMNELREGKPSQRYKQSLQLAQTENKDGPSKSTKPAHNHIMAETTKFKKLYRQKMEEKAKEAKRKATSNSIPIAVNPKKQKREENKKNEEKAKVTKGRLKFLW